MVTRRELLMGAAIAPSLRGAAQISMGEPVLVAEGPAEETRWGRYQFPNIERYDDGRIAVTFSVLADAAESYGKEPEVPNRSISLDGGKTWKLDTVAKRGRSGIKLPNGDLLKIFTPQAFPLSQLKLPRPAGEHARVSGGKYTLYKLSELPAALRPVWLSRMARGSSEWVQEQAVLNDPLALRYSLRELFPIVWWGDMEVAPDGSLIAGIYPGYLEGQKGFYWNTFFYVSRDNGKSWNVQGRILYEPDAAADPHSATRDGFSEPAFTLLRDGSAICIMRTSDHNGVGPMYMSRSKDLGKSWTRPAAFTKTGVLPRLLQLKNGALALSSGRPGVDLRVSFDGTGRTWSEPQTLVPVTSQELHTDSCGYTGLLPLDDQSFLIAYSHFKHKGTDGKLHKAILVRRVEVKAS